MIRVFRWYVLQVRLLGSRQTNWKLEVGLLPAEDVGSRKKCVAGESTTPKSGVFT